MSNRMGFSWFLVALLFGGVASLVGCGERQSEKRVAGESVDLTDVPQLEDRQAPVSKNGLKLDLISDLFFAGLVVHPQRMLEGGAITSEQVRAFMGEWANAEAVPLERCERILVLLPMISDSDQGMLPIVKFEFDGAVDLASMLESNPGGLLKESPSIEKLWTEPKGRAAAYQYSEDALLFGEREYVMAAVEDRLPRTGRLAELMGQLELDRDVVGILNAEALATMAGNGAGGNGVGGNGAQRATPPAALEFSIDLSDDPLGVLTVEAASEEDAKATKEQFGRSLQMAKMMGPLMIQNLAAEAPGQTRALLTKVTRELTSSLQVGVDGKQVKVSVSRPAELPQAIAGLAELLIESRKFDQREAKLQTIAKAMLKYHAEHDQFPLLAQLDGAFAPNGLSWRVFLLPALGHQELFARFHLDEPWDSEHNASLIAEMPDEFDTVEKTGETSIIIVQGDQTAWRPDQPTRIRDIQDGTIQTIMLFEAGTDKSTIWTKPDDVVDQPDKSWVQLGINRTPAMLVATFDGETRRISLRVSDKDIRALLSPQGEEDIDFRRKLGIPDPNQKSRGIMSGGMLPFGGFN